MKKIKYYFNLFLFLCYTAKNMNGSHTMADEIEFKYKVNPEYKNDLMEILNNMNAEYIAQGYLSNEHVSVFVCNENTSFVRIVTDAKPLSFRFTFDCTPEQAQEILTLHGVQGTRAYVKFDEHNIGRIRIRDKKAYLTFKGKAVGPRKPEIEFEIPVMEATQVLESCPTSVEKQRYQLPANQSDLIWEIDIFQGHNQGLILIEIEVPDENTLFEKPVWIGEDVTDNSDYANSNLAKPKKSHKLSL